MTGQQKWGASFANASVSAMSVYDEIMVPRLFEPWARLLLDELGPESGQFAVDVACGPGTVTRQAGLRVGPEGRVIGCDLSPAMLELARSKVFDETSAPIDYLECPADALDVADDAVDFVTCQQGLQFFPDRRAALAEMRRVLRPGGRLGLAVWCAIEQCPPFLALAEALEEVLGTEVAEAYRGGPWGFTDSNALVQLLNDGGYTNVTIQRRELPLVFEGGPGQLLMTLRAASAATAVAELSDSNQLAFASAVEAATRSITQDGIVHSRAAAHIVIANVGMK